MRNKYRFVPRESRRLVPKGRKALSAARLCRSWPSTPCCRLQASAMLARPVPARRCAVSQSCIARTGVYLRQQFHGLKLLVDRSWSRGQQSTRESTPASTCPHPGPSRNRKVSTALASKGYERAPYLSSGGTLAIFRASVSRNNGIGSSRSSSSVRAVIRDDTVRDLGGSGGGWTFRRTFMAPPYVWDRAGSIVPRSRGQTRQGVLPSRCNVRPSRGEHPIREYHCSHHAIAGAVPRKACLWPHPPGVRKTRKAARCHDWLVCRRAAQLVPLSI